MAAKQAVGRDDEPGDALDGLGDQAGDVAGGGRADHVLQVGGAGRDVLSVG